MSEMIFFDLDGTLIDPKNRYCTIYKELCNEIGIIPLDCNSYWNMKRKKVSEYDIFKKTNAKPYKIESILEKRVTMLENMKYLRLDTLHEGIIEFLNLVYKTHTLAIVTLRKNRVELEEQLKGLGVVQYFDKILSTAPTVNPKYMNKVKLIKDNYKGILKGLFFGDTEVDLLSGKYLTLKTVSCSFGIRNRKYLNEFSPNYNISSWDWQAWTNKLPEIIGI